MEIKEVTMLVTQAVLMFPLKDNEELDTLAYWKSYTQVGENGLSGIEIWQAQLSACSYSSRKLILRTFYEAVAQAFAHAKVLELCLRELLVTHTAHFKFHFWVKHVITVYSLVTAAPVK